MAAPDKAVLAADGDVALANERAGLIDKRGDRLAFGQRVAALVGQSPTKRAGSFATIRYADWIAANPAPTGGDAIGVLTVAGDIVDGKGGPGTAAGATLSQAVLDGLATKNLKALVVRVDSPGGSTFASEQIRLAVLEAKKQRLPVVISMGGIAASGGYWVATAGDAIFAEPNTITGSIGVFGFFPTFRARAGEGRRHHRRHQDDTAVGPARPLCGHDACLRHRAPGRHRKTPIASSSATSPTPAACRRSGSTRSRRAASGTAAPRANSGWSIASARSATRWRRRRGGRKLDPAKVHAVYLEKGPDWWAQLASEWGSDDEDDAAAGDAFAQAAAGQRQLVARAIGDVKRLATTGSVQARCLECAPLGPTLAAPGDMTLLDLLLARVGL